MAKPLGFANRILKREAINGARFGLVGLASTTVHVAIVGIAVTFTEITALVANALAFFMALGVSYTGNYLWTFRSPGEPRRALLRFFLVAIFALSLNSTILGFFLHKNWFEPLTAAAISAAVIPFITFLCSRLWVFEKFEKPSD